MWQLKTHRPTGGDESPVASCLAVTIGCMHKHDGHRMGASNPVYATSNRGDQVTVPQSALNSLIGEPDRHFHRAADLYIEGDADGAANEIRAAGALIRIEAGRGSVG